MCIRDSIGDDGRRTDIAPVDDEDSESESEEDEDVCAACGYGGELLICDGDGEDCVGLLHVACAGLDGPGGRVVLRPL